MAADLTQLARKIYQFEQLLSPDMVKKMLGTVGLKLKPEVQAGVARTPAKKGSLADGSMSGWGQRDGTPWVLTGMYEQPDWHSVEIMPVRKATGPMRVLEAGRKSYNAGDARVKGTYRSKKTGDLRKRYRKVRRNIGGQAGKGTWGDIAQVVDVKGPALYADERVKAINRILSRG